MKINIRCRKCGMPYMVDTIELIDEEVQVSVFEHDCQPTEMEWDKNFFGRLLEQIRDDFIIVRYNGLESGGDYRGWFCEYHFPTSKPGIHVSFLKEVDDGFQPRVLLIECIESITHEKTGFTYYMV